MKKISLLMVFLVALLGAAAFPAHADDADLFDAKAAAQHIEKGIADIQAKNFDAAIEEFEAAADANPDAEAYYYLGYAYYLKARAGDKESWSKSRENFDQAYEINPNFTPTKLKSEEPVPAPQAGQAEQSAPTATIESGPTATVESSPTSTAAVESIPTATSPADSGDQPAPPAPPADQQK